MVNGKFKCHVCNALNDSKLKHEEHIARHPYCELCDIYCSGEAPFQTHLAGNLHKSREPLQEEERPDYLFQCPACKEGFQTVLRLKDHLKNSHDVVIICKECEALGHNPVGQVLLCSELIDHYNQIHNKEMAQGDLPFYGRKRQGEMCPYCGDTVGKGSAGQNHIKRHHLHLTFACKQCQLAERFYYPTLDDVHRHLKLKHLGVGRNCNNKVVFPGSRANLAAFAWVKCKTCDFRGIGHGREVRNHLKSHLGSGEENLEIFCRICHKDDQALGIFEDFQEFIIHFEENHGDILPFLADQ